MNRTRPVDIPTAVRIIEKYIKAGEYGFFVETDFGRVAVEITYEEFDRNNQIHVCAWSDAPATGWCLDNRDEQADVYVNVGLRVKNSDMATHLRVVEAVTRVAMSHFMGHNLSQEKVDAGIISYVRYVDENEPTLNALEEEFCKVNLPIITRRNEIVRDLVRQNIKNRIRNAENEINVGRIACGCHIPAYVNSMYERNMCCLIGRSRITSTGLMTA